MWFSDTSSCPKVFLESNQFHSSVALKGPGDTSFTDYSANIGTVGYEFRGLTQAAAFSIATSKNVYPTSAYAYRANEAGGYNVRVVTRSQDSFTP